MSPRQTQSRKQATPAHQTREESPFFGETIVLVGGRKTGIWVDERDFAKLATPVVRPTHDADSAKISKLDLGMERGTSQPVLSLRGGQGKRKAVVVDLDSDESPVSTLMKKRRGQGPRKRTKVQAQSSEESERPVLALQKRRHRRPQASVESSSDSDIAPPAPKRRRVAQRRVSEASSGSEFHDESESVSEPSSGSEFHDESKPAAEPKVRRQPARVARTRGRLIKAPVSRKRVTQRAATPEPSIAFPEVSEEREFSLSLSPEDRADAERLRKTAREAARFAKPASSPARGDDSEAEKSDSSWTHVQIISELGDVSIIDAKNDPTVTRPEQGVEEFLENQYRWGQEWRDIVIQGWLYDIRTVGEIQDELIEAGFRDQIEWEEIQYYLRCSGLWWADPESETVS